jgi:hypothetical protein
MSQKKYNIQFTWKELYDIKESLYLAHYNRECEHIEYTPECPASFSKEEFDRCAKKQIEEGNEGKLCPGCSDTLILYNMNVKIEKKMAKLIKKNSLKKI